MIHQKPMIQQPASQTEKRIAHRFLALIVLTLALAMPMMAVFADVPGITSDPVTEAVAEQAYNYTVVASGSPAPTFTLTIAPQGMTINENSGEIAWTPALTQTGNADVTVVATNVDGTDSQSFAIAVASLPEITSAAVTDAVVGQPYVYTVLATGDPSPTFTLSVFPTGMQIDENSGQITWTPTDATDQNVTVNAVNAAGSDSQSFTINVTQEPAITSTPITTGTVNEVYEYTVLAVGDPSPTFTLTTAPTGMSINEITGLISWEPDSPGVYDVTVEAINPLGTADQSFSIAVNAVCPAGMVSYWRLDETSGLVFADYLGANPATFSGSGNPGFVSGVVNGAVDLAGTNQRLATANTSNPTSGLTLLAWINPDDLSGNDPDQGIISKEGAFSLDIESNGDKISFVVINGSDDDEFEPDVPANVIFEDEWTFVAATFDGTRMRIYINGTEVGNEESPISSLGNSGTGYELGSDANWANRYFDGSIDETAVFNRALSPAEIQLQYSRTLADEGYCDAENAAPDIVSTPVLTATAGLPYTYDVDASGNPGITYSLLTPPAGMTIDSVTGVISWTPTASGDYTIRVRATNSLGTDPQNYTLTVTAVTPEIISSPVTNAITGYPYIYDVDATGLPTPTYSLQESPGGMTIDDVTGVISWPSPTTGSHPVTVVATNSGGSYPQSFTIDVTEPSSVCPSNMASYWRLDETSGTTFPDSFGANDVTFSGSGSPGYTTGQVKGALDLNGSNQKLVSANTSNPTDAVTLMAWVNPDNLGGTVDRGIISKDGAFVLEVETAVGGVGSHNGISFTLFNASWYEFEPNVPANQIPTGTWTHVAATFDGSTATIYINGQVVGSTTQVPIAIGNTVSAYNIGFTEPFGNNDRYFDGIIDEVSVFNEALTLVEIQEIYNNTLAGDTYCEITPKITSQPVTIGEIQQLYTYNVDATGNPAPTFILTNSPSGMTIDANTGIISWMPDTPGTYNISVEAQNFAGFDEQNFQIIIPNHKIFLPIIVR